MTGTGSNQTKRLVHVATVPLSLFCFLDGQVRHMMEQGYEVHGVASAGPLLQRFAEREGCRVHEVEMPRAISPLQDLRAVWQLYLLFRKLRPDIVHCHTPKGGLLGTIAAFLARVPVRIYQVHGLPHVTASGLKRRLLCCTERISCVLAGQVYCVSASLRDLVLEEGFCAPGKVAVLQNGSINGVDAAQRYNPSRHDGGALRCFLGIPDGAPVLGFVGRMVRDKGILELLESWRELRERHRELHLVLVGPFEERDALPDFAKQELLRDDRVRVIGQVDDPAPYYAAMDLLAFPSHREGFGLVNVEASAMGLPVVSTRITGCVDSVRDGVTGVLVPPGDSAALTVALALFLADPRKRAEYGSAGRQWVLQRFQPRQIWGALSAEYQRLLIARANLIRMQSMKRLFDLACAVSGLLLLSPVLLVTALLVRVKLGSPVLFRQQRPGLHGSPFHVYKFRTMTDQRGPDGKLLPDSVRLTPFGLLLRRFSLDELPQLFNVVKGDLSMVGPRPLLMEYLPLYSPEQARRHEVRPGITGWAQVNGRNAIGWDEKFRLDVWYVEHRSFRLDLRILWRTVAKVFKREGISQDGQATMEPFMGSKAEGVSGDR